MPAKVIDATHQHRRRGDRGRARACSRDRHTPHVDAISTSVGPAAAGRAEAAHQDRIERDLDHRNNLAVGVSWAAEQLAVARLDASASGVGFAA